MGGHGKILVRSRTGLPETGNNRKTGGAQKKAREVIPGLVILMG